MEKENLVSIVVPCYNTKIEFLEYCMKSLLDQTYKNLEIILVDDGSEKDISNLLDENWGDNIQVKIFHKKNEGVSVARNFGTQKSSGSYILYVDADDMLAPCAVENAMEIALQNHADIVYGRIEMISDHNAIINDCMIQEKIDILKSYKDVKRLISHIFTKNDLVWDNKDLVGEFNGEGPWAKLVKKESAQRISFPAGIRIGEDTIWNILLLKQESLTACVTNRIWYYYYQNQEGAINTFSQDKIDAIKDQIKYLNKYIYNNPEYAIDYFKWLKIKIKNQLIYGYFLNEKNMMTRKEKRVMFKNTIQSEPWNVIKHYSGLGLKNYVWIKLCWNGNLIWLYDLKKRLKIFKYYLQKQN